MTKQNQLPSQNEPAVTVLLVSLLNPNEVLVDFSDGTTMILTVDQLVSLSAKRIEPLGDRESF